MDVLIALVHLLVIVAIAFLVRKRQPLHRRFFWPALAARLLGGVCLGLLYTYYYPVADTFVYFQDASAAARFARTDLSGYLTFLFTGHNAAEIPLVITEPRSLFFTRITSVFTLLTNNNYWAISFYYSFFSFLAAWSLVQTLSRNTASVSFAAIVAFLFLPSVVLWTSGVLKESLAIASLFFLTSLFLEVWFAGKLRWWQPLVAALFFGLLWSLKYYYAGVFIAVAGTSLLTRYLAKRFDIAPGTQPLVWVVTFALPAVAVTFLHPNFHLDRLLTVVVENNAAYLALSSADNVVGFYNLEATPWSLLLNAPWALISGLLRPFPWEASSLLHLCAALENTFLLFFFLTSLLYLKRLKRPKYPLLLFSAVFFVLVLAVFLTLSAPNFGTLSRYRTGYISFFCLIVLVNNPAFHRVKRLLFPLVIEERER